METLEHRDLLAMAGVDVINTTFAPNPVTIHLGDTVEWVWDSNGLSTTSVAGSTEQWNSGVQTKGFTFSHTFTHLGTFSYYSTVGGHDNGNGTAGGMSGQIIVLPPSPVSMVMVTPPSFSVAEGANMEYMAMAMYADNTMEDVPDNVTWASSNPAIATVSNAPGSQGLVTGLAPGTATISATLDGMSGSTSISVTAAAPSPVVSVTSVQDTLNKQHMVTGITIDFSGPLSAPEASNVRFYQLAMPGRKGSFDGSSARMLNLKSAVYDGALNEVVLTPKRPFALSKPVQLTVNGRSGSGLQDTAGQSIDGDGDGAPGGDAVVVLSRKGMTLNGVPVATSAMEPVAAMPTMGTAGSPANDMMPMGPAPRLKARS
jgi:plastocyanin